MAETDEAGLEHNSFTLYGKLAPKIMNDKTILQVQYK